MDKYDETYDEVIRELKRNAVFRDRLLQKMDISKEFVTSTIDKPGVIFKCGILCVFAGLLLGVGWSIGSIWIILGIICPLAAVVCIVLACSCLNKFKTEMASRIFYFFYYDRLIEAEVIDQKNWEIRYFTDKLKRYKRLLGDDESYADELVSDMNNLWVYDKLLKEIPNDYSLSVYISEVLKRKL